MDATATYSLYLENDLNRVFTDAVPDLAATELRIVADRTLADAVGPIERVVGGRTAQLRFPADAGNEAVSTLVARLCASAALFRHHRPAGDGPDLLEPLTLDEDLVYGTELVTTQRYRGKTNERLTRAMVNIALATAGIDPAKPSGVLLDPMCGRGTTLNWALVYGLDAIGIDVDRAAVEQHRAFLETWAKRQRLPHKATRHKAGNAEQRSLSFRVAPDRASLKADRGQHVQTFNADGADDQLPIRARSVDVVVGDLPYGVQHRGSGSGRNPTGDRAPVDDPVALLERALPTWRRWLRPGGALCLAWNLKQADRSAISRVLVEAGFDPVVAAGGFTMRHVVDATIERDVIAAHRPR